MRYFPQNRKAKQATLAEQVSKVIEEFGEVIDAVMKGNRVGAAEECFDLIQATEGLLDKIMPDESERSLTRMLTEGKCYSRGDYDSQTWEDWSSEMEAMND